jgi:hypothetical protein
MFSKPLIVVARMLMVAALAGWLPVASLAAECACCGPTMTSRAADEAPCCRVAPAPVRPIALKPLNHRTSMPVVAPSARFLPIGGWTVTTTSLVGGSPPPHLLHIPLRV